FSAHGVSLQVTAHFPEELGLPTQPTGSGPSSVYYTTGFSHCEIQDLCVLIEEIQSSIPEADRRDWPPILALGNSVVITLRCWPGRWHATSPRPRSCGRTASTSWMERCCPAGHGRPSRACIRASTSRPA